MKSAICGCTCIIVMVCTFMLIAGITTGSAAKQKAINTASDCTYSAVASLYDWPEKIESDQDMVDAFYEGAETYLKSQGAVCDINIYTADHELGLMDVEVICKYRDAFQIEREVPVRRTVVIDSIAEQN